MSNDKKRSTVWNLMIGGVMADSDGEKSVRVLEIGKEIDRTIAQVVGELLKPPAKELGSLFGDTIGILTDKIRVKRQINAERALESARRQLENKGVDLTAIANPPAEDVQLLLNGMSLNDDSIINDMWAGLFAQAFDPASQNIERRAFIKVLETFSPLDARIVDFIKFFDIERVSLSKNIKNFTPKDWANITVEENTIIESNKVHNADVLSATETNLRSKADEYGLDKLPKGWSDNLLRQGIIEPNLSSTSVGSIARSGVRDIDDLKNLVAKVAQKVEDSDRIKRVRLAPPDTIFSHKSALVYRFTNFGARFADECGIS